jgi:hypothetical protein
MMKTARDGGVSQKYAIGESSVRIDCPSANWLLLLPNARRKETQLDATERASSMDYQAEIGQPRLA